MELLVAVLLDWLIGDPHSFPHPVKLMGRIISFEERIVRKIFKEEGKKLKIGGFLIVVLNIFLAFIVPYLILKCLKGYRLLYSIINIYFIYSCLAPAAWTRRP